MNIYDVKLYGAYYPTERGKSEVRMSPYRYFVDRRLSASVVFEATVLKKFKGKEDVLELKFRDGDVEYQTLYQPGYYYEDEEWKEISFREAPNAFLKACADLEFADKTENRENIFNTTFYGVINKGVSKPKVQVYVSKVDQMTGLSDESELFTAKVLKSFKGEKYVARLEVRNSPYEYVKLFSPEMCYDAEHTEWVVAQRSEIPEKIIKCYMEHLKV